VAVVESKFGFSQAESHHKVIANDHIQSEEEYMTFTEEWIDAVKPYLAKKNSIYIFNCDRMIFALKNAMQKTGCHFAQLLIWVKTQAVIGRMDYLPQHELIAYGWFGRHKFRHSKDKSVLIFPKPTKSSLHPTMKPIGLLRKLILNSTEVNDIVYDPFAGSGSSIIAAEQTKRRCFAVEYDLDYCLKIISRYEKLTGISVEKIS
jgi:DNA modification methylase